MNTLSVAPSILFPCIHSRISSTCYSRYTSRLHRVSLCSSSSPFIRSHVLLSRRLSIHATLTPPEGTVAVVDFEDLAEKDWFFLDSDETNSKEELDKKNDRVIAAGKIGEISKVLVSIGSDDFVDKLVDTSPGQSLLVVHESLFVLAGIKERYDKVKCWQGELIHVPETWGPFDSVFLYFLPGLEYKLDDVLRALSGRCSTGARVVISHLQGRHALQQQRQQFPDVVLSDLPDKTTLEKVAADHSFVTHEFVDEPGFYLVVLELNA